ncbi:hypothetical protein MBANPS3_011516 [Mucor bainieri]
MVKVNSANTLRVKITNKAQELKNRLRNVLQQQSKLHFTLDVWTATGSTRGGSDYLGVTVHWIRADYYPRRQTIFGFEQLKEEADTGRHLADVFV